MQQRTRGMTGIRETYAPLSWLGASRQHAYSLALWRRCWLGRRPSLGAQRWRGGNRGARLYKGMRLCADRRWHLCRGEWPQGQRDGSSRLARLGRVLRRACACFPTSSRGTSSDRHRYHTIDFLYPSLALPWCVCERIARRRGSGELSRPTMSYPWRWSCLHIHCPRARIIRRKNVFGVVLRRRYGQRRSGPQSDACVEVLLSATQGSVAGDVVRQPFSLRQP